MTIFFENRTLHKRWKNTVEQDRPQATIRRMRIAYWIPKATNTHSEYVILIAFPLQQWLHARASMLLDIVGTVYHLVIYMQSNKIHKVCVSCWTAYILPQCYVICTLPVLFILTAIIEVFTL